MISIWGPDINYTPDYWPLWLKFGALLVIVTVLGILVHGALRLIYAQKSIAKSEPEKFYLYILPVRVWHWVNALFFLTLLFTGLLNHFSIGPTKFMVKIHNWAGAVYIAVWAAFIIINIVTGNGKHYILAYKGAIKRVMKQAHYYIYGMIKGEPRPFSTTGENKFNPIQQLTYIGVIYMLIPLFLITGAALLYGKSFLISKIHLGLGIVGLIFLLIHVYMCTTGDSPTYLLKGMIDGYHRHEKK